MFQAFRRVAQSYPRVLKLVWQASPSYTILTILLTIISSAVAPAQIWISKVIIDRVTESLRVFTQEASVDWYAVLLPIGLIFLVWIVGGVCQSLMVGIREIWGFQVWIYGEHSILRKATQLDLAFYETPAFYDQMENARRDGYRIYNLAMLCIEVFGGILSLVAVLGLLFRLHPLAVVALLLTTVPQVIVGGYYANRRFTLMGTHTSDRRMASYLSNLLGSRDAVKEIRLFGLHELFLERFRQFWQKFLGESKSLQFSQERANLLLSGLSMAGTAAIWAYAVIQAVLGRITIGDVALAFQAAEQSRNGLSHLFSTGGIFYEHSLFANNLFSFLDLAPDSVEGALSRPKASDGKPHLMPRPIREGVEFNKVSFRYPGSDRLVLKNLSFFLRPGETVAVVGENGAGKTTLVKLLARFYDPTEGSILLDGKDLREYDLEDLHRHIGVIFQDLRL